MYNNQSGQPQVVHVKIEDVNIPFLHLVGLMLKVAIAAIPAAIVMGLLGLVVSALATGTLAGIVSILSNVLRR